MTVEFTLRFPFEVSPGRQIQGINPAPVQKVGNLTFRWEQQDHFYILKVSGFNSELEAREYTNQIWAGLMWVMLNKNIAFSFNKDIDKVVYALDPLRANNLLDSLGIPFEAGFDGFANGNFPSIYPSDKKMRFEYAGSMTPILVKPVGQIFDILVEGISLAKSTNSFSDAKFRTALELYGAYYYEKSGNARLLTLIMALETLTTSNPKPEFIQKILASWQQDVDRLKNSLEPESEDYESLVALERELLFRREKSLRSQIRTLVFDTLQMSGAPDAKELADKAVKIYDKRSTLVHEGALPVKDLNWAETEAKAVVEAVLRAKFMQAASRERT